MDKKHLLSVVIGLAIGAGGLFAYSPTKEACDKLTALPLTVSDTVAAP